jgi:hypothetical protein
MKNYLTYIYDSYITMATHKGHNVLPRQSGGVYERPKQLNECSRCI